MPRGPAKLFSGLFFLSGMAGLVYEVCWTRLLRLPMGNTVYSTTAVLTAFMAGLALGSYVAGRRIDRRGHPLRVYALLEGAIGLFCLVLPWIVQAEGPLFRWAYQHLGSSFLLLHLVKFLACGVVVLVPATLMGATLPVLCRYFMDDPARIGMSVGWLYAVNALGAVAGSLLAGFVLLPHLGQRGAMLSGVAISLSVAALAWRAQRRFQFAGGVAPAASSDRDAPVDRAAPARTEPAPPERATRKSKRAAAHAATTSWRRTTARPAALPVPLGSGVHLAVLVGYGLSGLAAMVFQIAWARVLALVIGSSVYAFALLVSAFILGLAVGSAVVSRFADRLRRPVLGFAVAEIGIGATALAMAPVFQRFPDWMLRIVPGVSQNFGRFELVQFGLILMTLLLPTACMGMCLPLVGRAVARGLENAAQAVGTAYSSNAAGTIVGAFVGGFLLVPGLGTHRAILVGAGVNLAVGAVLLALALPRRAGWPAAASVAVAGGLGLAFLPPFDATTLTSGSYLYAEKLRHTGGGHASVRSIMREQFDILYHKEGLSSTITVKETLRSGSRSLAVNGKVDASDLGDMATQELLGHLPCLLHPRPLDVAVIGLASGVTLHAVAMHPSVRSIDCIEIAPEMVEASRYFEHVNGGVLRDPRVHLVIQDGRNHLALTNRSYDVIVSEPSNPWIAGIASLFTREFLGDCAARLRPHGVMCLWMHIYGLDEPTIRSLSRTYIDIFPHATLWESGFAGDYLLIGSKDEIAIEWDDLVARLREPGVGADLARIGMHDPASLLVRQVADEAGVNQLAAGGEVYTDDRNRLEFDAPRLLYHQTKLGEVAVLQALRGPGFPAWLRLPAGGAPASEVAALRAARQGQAEFWRGMQNKIRGNPEAAERAFLTALEFDPHVHDLPDNLLETTRQVAARATAAHDTLGAMQLYQRILELNPDLADFHNDLGALLGGQRRLAEAEAEYRKAAALWPRTLYTHMNLALALALQGKLAEAEEQYRIILVQRPAHVQARVLLGGILSDRGDLQGAEREARAAIAARPDLFDGWLLLGEALLRQGSYGPALEALQTAEKRGAPEARAQLLLAECYRKRGENDKAALAEERVRALARTR